VSKIRRRSRGGPSPQPHAVRQRGSTNLGAVADEQLGGDSALECVGQIIEILRDETLTAGDGPDDVRVT
jgi:hypothetical protein